MPKKKKEINLKELNPDETLIETVTCGMLGRVLASYGATLTQREKRAGDLMYSLIQAKRLPSEDLPVIANISMVIKSDVKKYTQTQAIAKFKETYPKQAQPLLKLLDERHNKNVPALNYGLREGETLSDEYCVDLLTEKLGISKPSAKSLYEKIIKPRIEEEREDSGLIQKLIK